MKEMQLPLPTSLLLERFDAPGVRSIIITGSYARGKANPYSDLDLVRLTDGSEVPGEGSYLLDGVFVVVSNKSPDALEACFTDPRRAVAAIGALQTAIPLLDRDAYFTRLQQRARAFTWTDELQQQANRFASEELVGLIEEVRKGLAGLRSKDIGRMLNAQFGLTWSLSRVMMVQQGMVFASSDNAVYEGVATRIGLQSRWVRLRRQAFGIEDEHGTTPTLREQIIAGLWLYVETVCLLEAVLQAEDAPLIQHTVELIRRDTPPLPGFEQY
ncbi:nucleotidyltransferase-like protein [Thermosporothrix hazakensis]|jgi:hypothetical protein|uniref:Nucleotidyltransferase-like protein n=2 Tax=Thermosporothrix TaxID=768650 RepID=A0A326U7N6_THEHA|nr:nucleotidyltransferase domain-containing protein [Thermosporothrix hazakensis]PZW29468.1 nucleotidyltransferase-like protein [Thermosporothrix hazakensis]BBH85753.1 hypothetical protein KTC_05040 [Thermosporothrix sp. COM3]GCE45817.1 hypothetical protein KTH_06860 [Thermosporothrix hazakensis]